jgi:hypothetical protein
MFEAENISRCSSVVEHFLGKEEVVSSILINGSKTKTKTGLAQKQKTENKTN